MKSAELREEFAQEENDLKSLGIFGKILREERLEKFSESTYLAELDKRYTVEYLESIGKYVIKTIDFGTLDFYPKANKLLIRKKNKWVKPGLKWLINNLKLKTDK